MRQKRSVSRISTHLASAKGEGNGLSRKADPEVGLAARPRHTSPSSSTLPTDPTECVPFAAGQRPCIPQDPTIRARWDYIQAKNKMNCHTLLTLGEQTYISISDISSILRSFIVEEGEQLIMISRNWRRNGKAHSRRKDGEEGAGLSPSTAIEFATEELLSLRHCILFSVLQFLLAFIIS